MITEERAEELNEIFENMAEGDSFTPVNEEEHIYLLSGCEPEDLARKVVYWEKLAEERGRRLERLVSYLKQSEIYCDHYAWLEFVEDNPDAAEWFKPDGTAK